MSDKEVNRLEELQRETLKLLEEQSRITGQLEAEKKKLREALKKIAEFSYPEAPYIFTVDRIWILATEALKDGE